jgi:hypothetical protein
VRLSLGRHAVPGLVRTTDIPGAWRTGGPVTGAISRLALGMTSVRCCGSA